MCYFNITHIKSHFDVFVLPQSNSVTKQIVATTNAKLRFIQAYIKLKSEDRTGSVKNKVLVQVQVRQI